MCAGVQSGTNSSRVVPLPAIAGRGDVERLARTRRRYLGGHFMRFEAHPGMIASRSRSELAVGAITSTYRYVVHEVPVGRACGCGAGGPTSDPTPACILEVRVC